jgi:uncharacterized RDD family membrane protein YckC
VTRSTPYPPPALPRRLAAAVYDTLLVTALVFVVSAVALGVQVKLNPAAGDVLEPHLTLLLIAVTTLGFFCFFWSRGGQTLGMQAWRIKLVDSAGRAPAPGRALLRVLAALLSAACLGLGYLWCLIDRRGRYWHDYLSGTELVLLPKREKRRRKSSKKSGD